MNIFLNYRLLFLLLLPIAGICQNLEPQGFEMLEKTTLQIGDLTVDFVDNHEQPPNHRAGYNGIAGLYHSDQAENIFVPAYAGFNLEHIFDGDSLIELFEPRKNIMRLYRKSDKEILLYQPETPISKVESLTHFTLVEPHYIDVNFSCVINDMQFFDHGYAGLFWASYINKPQDRLIYFKGISNDDRRTRWISAFSNVHGKASTHRQINDHHDLYFAPNFNASLASHFSLLNFKDHFYYGRFRNMVFAYFFQSDQIIRFSQSPTGGGDSNPAWDFQFLISNPIVGKVYNFQARLLYKPFISAEDVLAEFESWIR